MAITINGSGTVTGISAGGLPDNCITADDLATTLDLSGNTITLPSGTGGKVLQVVNSDYSGEITTTNTSTLVDTGLSATITPSSTSSKILVIATNSGVRGWGGTGQNGVHIELFRDSTYLKRMSNRAANLGTDFGNSIGSVSISYLDSPATTSAITYKTQFYARVEGNARVQDDNATSTITLMEIAG